MPRPIWSPIATANSLGPTAVTGEAPGQACPGQTWSVSRRTNAATAWHWGRSRLPARTGIPPSVVSDLKQQLEHLRDQTAVRDHLLLYLSYRAESAPWHARFKAASVRYLRDKSDFHLYGFLVRDVPADERDLRSLARNFAQDSGSHPRMELLALYLPGGSIEGIGRALADRRRGAER